MFCPNCGTKNDDDALFCGECGTRLAEEMPEAAANIAQQTQDMTIDAVVESKIGTAIIVDSLVGKYTIV